DQAALRRVSTRVRTRLERPAPMRTNDPPHRLPVPAVRRSPAAVAPEHPDVSNFNENSREVAHQMRTSRCRSTREFSSTFPPARGGGCISPRLTRCRWRMPHLIFTADFKPHLWTWHWHPVAPRAPTTVTMGHSRREPAFMRAWSEDDIQTQVDGA